MMTGGLIIFFIGFGVGWIISRWGADLEIKRLQSDAKFWRDAALVSAQAQLKATYDPATYFNRPAS